MPPTTPLKRFRYLTFYGDSPAAFAFHIGALYYFAREGLLSEVKEIRVQRGCSVFIVLYMLQYWPELVKPDMVVDHNENSDACQQRVVIPLQILFFQPVDHWVELMNHVHAWHVVTLATSLAKYGKPLPHVYIFSSGAENDCIALDLDQSFADVATKAVKLWVERPEEPTQEQLPEEEAKRDPTTNAHQSLASLCVERSHHVQNCRVPPKVDAFRHQHWIFYAGGRSDLDDFLDFHNNSSVYPKTHGLLDVLVTVDMTEESPVPVCFLEREHDKKITLEHFQAFIEHGKERTKLRTAPLRELGVTGVSRISGYATWTEGSKPEPPIRPIVYTGPRLPAPAKTPCGVLFQWWQQRKKKKKQKEKKEEPIPATPVPPPLPPFPVTIAWRSEYTPPTPRRPKTPRRDQVVSKASFTTNPE